MIDSRIHGAPQARQFRLALVWLLWAFLILPRDRLTADEVLADDLELRLNQIQVIGTHNSYHLAPEPALMKLIGLAGRGLAESIDYTHRPIVEQLDQLGMRQLEFDLYADPDGGRYAKPLGWNLLGGKRADMRMPFDFERELTQPGFKIIHAPGFDFATTVPSLHAALTQVLEWSNRNPNHLPILILLELKESIPAPAGITALPFDGPTLDQLDRMIQELVPASKRLTPDGIRGHFATLREAVREQGWPRLRDCRGKLIFALDNTNGIRERYLAGHPTLQGRMMFASVDAEHPAAAWIKLNDPRGDFESIRKCVRDGLLVRTRADADTRAARQNDSTQRDRAFESGAQFISTDYPQPDVRFSDYQVRWPDGRVYRRNPVALAP
jgi:hypothetical protein